MAEKKPTKTAAATTDTAREVGTTADGVDLNDPSLKGGTDNPDAQADNERRMQAAAGTDRPVVEQLQEPTFDPATAATPADEPKPKA